jgi:hypothetical protein
VLERCPFGAGELARCLELWEETVDELFTGETAELAEQPPISPAKRSPPWCAGTKAASGRFR